jgi:cell fate regulator YaaT (PSP1 superfamily)
MCVSEPARGFAPRRSLRRVLRKATPDDERHYDHNASKEREAFRFCLERIRSRELPMKLVSAEFLHSDNKAIFYFSATGRVDFRGLVKDLASHLWTRIEMRQIGIRDEAKMVGGIGSCGRELCCTTWLPEFTPVTIKMAKYQGLVLNPQKVSGLCGRLMCCLGYEQDHYAELRRILPRVGSTVRTPDGVGKVKELQLLRKTVKVLVGEAFLTFDASEVGPVDAGEPDEPDETDDSDASSEESP